MDKKGRTTVEAAEDVIRENREQIDWYRTRIIDRERKIKNNRASIESCEKEITNLRHRINQLTNKIDDLNGSIERLEAEIINLDAERFDYIVTNLALNQFIQAGGGLDMMVD